MRLVPIIAGAVAATGAVVAGVFGKRAYDDAVTLKETREKMATGGAIKLRLTAYWPWAAKTEAEKKMEGGFNDRKGRPLRALEDFFSGKADHVSLSGDDAAWPYGQRVEFDLGDGRRVIGRVTDTGGNFRGANKQYRKDGFEPIDVCVRDKATKVPTTVQGLIIAGDHLDKSGKLVATNLFKGQDVSLGGLDLFGAEDEEV